VAALAGLGRVYYSQGRYSEAARFLQSALGEAGDSPVLQSMYGDSLWRIGRQIESEVAFQHSMYMSGTEAAPSRRYARALAEWGRLDEAAVFGERALLLDENDTETLRLLVAAGVAVE
jgi:tetratricopeptide (TPR) repeat protein